ncbi:MAG: hypothetical protein H7145_05845 [Akkermansiaceae bacterium]|nr:hypothetical protein [Armatimonadota bacterium]
MTTIRLFPPHPENGRSEYLAVFGKETVSGKSAGEAVGAAINLLQEHGGDISTARIFMQKLGGDEFFTDAQIAHMKELIQERNSSWDAGSEPSEANREELESLIFAELEASGRRVEKWNLSTVK